MALTKEQRKEFDMNFITSAVLGVAGFGSALIFAPLAAPFIGMTAIITGGIINTVAGVTSAVQGIAEWTRKRKARKLKSQKAQPIEEPPEHSQSNAIEVEQSNSNARDLSEEGLYDLNAEKLWFYEDAIGPYCFDESVKAMAVNEKISKRVWEQAIKDARRNIQPRNALIRISKEMLISAENDLKKQHETSNERKLKRAQSHTSLLR